MNEATPLLEISGLDKTFGGLLVISDLDIDPSARARSSA